METTILKVQFEDGSEFRVFCQNASQFSRVYRAANKKGAKFGVITNGIHTTKQFEKILTTK